MEKRPAVWRVAANILNKQSRTADKAWPSSLEIGRGANKRLSTVKTFLVRKSSHRGNLRKRGHLGDPGVDGRLILRWIFRKWDVRVWTGSSWLGVGAFVNAVMNLHVL
jgi:hypothetical protein